MITDECSIFVVNKGFTALGDLTPGDQVYTLDGLGYSVTPIGSVSSEFVRGRINSIDSGAQNVDASDDARFLYYSVRYGLKYLAPTEIANHAPNKGYDDYSYLPVLSYPNFGEGVKSDQQLESLARCLAIGRYDRDLLDECMRDITSEDAMVLIDMLEFWCSSAPGRGWFERVSVKSRSHEIKDVYFLDQLCLAAILAGYTAAVTQYEPYKYALKVSYTPMPIPGSRPKNEKYQKKFFAGLMYNVDAGNKPILGKSRGRVFYLPTTSTLQKGEI